MDTGLDNSFLITNEYFCYLIHELFCLFYKNKIKYYVWFYWMIVVRFFRWTNEWIMNLDQRQSTLNDSSEIL